MIKRLVQNLLHKELSYALHGAAIEVRKDFGPGHKERLYQNAFVEELKRRKISFEKEKAIKIYSPKDGKYIGLYRPDFIVDKKIIVEIKAEKFVNRDEIKRIYDYLRNSEYELAYFINFASPRLYIKRIILTNDRKPFLKTLLVFISLIFVCFGVLSEAAQAARLYFEPSQTMVGLDNPFFVDLKIDSEEPINALEVTIDLPKELVVPKDIYDGNSIINFWLDKPTYDQSYSQFYFSGIIPGGFSGQGGRLLLIQFQPQKQGRAEISFNQEKTQAFLNTPEGEKAPLSLIDTYFDISPYKKTIETLPPDFDLPEPFKPEISQNKEVFEGKYFLVFATSDKGWGISHYQIQEKREFRIWNLEFRKKDSWLEAESPYLLKDQKMRSYIYVKAVDKAGNERIAVVEPRYPLRWYENYLFWVIIILGIFFAFITYAIVKILWRKKITH